MSHVSQRDPAESFPGTGASSPAGPSMGLGSDARGEWHDYEWFDPHLSDDGDDDAALVTVASLEREGGAAATNVIDLQSLEAADEVRGA